MQKKNKAFTLIELLVVIAIISLLLAVLLPSLTAARESAKTVACGVQLKMVGTLTSIYCNNFDDFLPGMNTSGVALRALQGATISRLQNGKLPTQPHDWITPLMRLETEMPDKRASRFHMATQFFSCPSQKSLDSSLYGTPPDQVDFQQMSPWHTLSYLMPVHFQYWGQKDRSRILAYNNIAPTLTVRSLAAPTTWEVIVENFSSKIDNVGPPATKVLVSDGTRYLNEQGLDHDIGLFPTYFGSFTSSGAWWAGSSEFGTVQGSRNWSGSAVVEGSPANGQNLSLSYRHGSKGSGTTCESNKGSINAVFFDGHVQRLNDRTSRDIKLWYPKNSKVNPNYTHGVGMTNVDKDVPIY